MSAFANMPCGHCADRMDGDGHCRNGCDGEYCSHCRRPWADCVCPVTAMTTIGGSECVA
jgi:hypothetical protein